MDMAQLRTSWGALNPRLRQVVIAAGAVDATLRVAALIDLARRPSEQVRGPKWAWGLGLSVVNSAGVLPVAYFTTGRG